VVDLIGPHMDRATVRVCFMVSKMLNRDILQQSRFLDVTEGNRAFVEHYVPRNVKELRLQSLPPPIRLCTTIVLKNLEVVECKGRVNPAYPMPMDGFWCHLDMYCLRELHIHTQWSTDLDIKAMFDQPMDIWVQKLMDNIPDLKDPIIPLQSFTWLDADREIPLAVWTNPSLTTLEIVLDGDTKAFPGAISFLQNGFPADAKLLIDIGWHDNYCLLISDLEEILWQGRRADSMWDAFEKGWEKHVDIPLDNVQFRAGDYTHGYVVRDCCS